jgi:hypothetical protein
MPTGTTVGNGVPDLGCCLKLMPTGTASNKGGVFDWLKGCLMAFSPLEAMIDDFLKLMPTGTVVIGDGFRRLDDWLKGCLMAFSPLEAMIDDFLKLMPTGTVVIGDGFRRLGDWLVGCPAAISPPLAWLVVIVLGVLKLMPRGADASVILLVQRDPGNGFR